MENTNHSRTDRELVTILTRFRPAHLTLPLLGRLASSSRAS